MVVLSVAVFSVIRPTVRIVEPFCTSRKSAVMTMFGSENATDSYIASVLAGLSSVKVAFTVAPVGRIVNVWSNVSVFPSAPLLPLLMKPFAVAVAVVAFSDPNIVITADFRLVQNGSTIRTVGRITLNTATDSTTIHVAVSLDGHPVASIDGDPSSPGTQWVDAGGQPLTVDDLAALDHLFDVWENFQEAVTGLFAPISTFATL